MNKAVPDPLVYSYGDLVDALQLSDAGLPRGPLGDRLERELNACGVLAARVRTLREFTREAVDTGLLQPVVLSDGEAQCVKPGMGWRTDRVR